MVFTELMCHKTSSYEGTNWRFFCKISRISSSADEPLLSEEKLSSTEILNSVLQMWNNSETDTGNIIIITVCLATGP
jgi:hypothetical protein